MVPKATELTMQGTVTDNQTVSSLKINGTNIPLRGTEARKTFGVKLRAPTAGKVKTLEFLAQDKSGNRIRKLYQITRQSASGPPTLALLEPEAGSPAVAAPVPASPPTPEGTSSTPDVQAPSSGEYWALVIGVSDYPHPSLNELTYPVTDAQEFSEVLTQNYTFEPEKVRHLFNPTREQLIGAISDYTPTGVRPLGENDNLLIFYAGHGYWDENYQEGYWLPSDAEQKNRANWVSNSDIQRACKAIKARHLLLLSDACFSGSLFATRQPFNIAVFEAYKEPSRKAITAGNFTVVPDRSVFKEYLVKYLQENTEPYLDAGELYNSIKEPITNNSPTRQRPIYGVIQQTGDEGGEFIFVRRK